jgi:hypothetical protein
VIDLTVIPPVLEKDIWKGSISAATAKSNPAGFALWRRLYYFIFLGLSGRNVDPTPR